MQVPKFASNAMHWHDM